LSTLNKAQKGKEDPMHYVGIDLHKRFLVAATESSLGEVGRPVRLDCRDVTSIHYHFSDLRPFTCVIEASSSYRWLYELLRTLGDVKLAHPLRLKAMVSGRAKTDKIDAALLAKLLRVDLIPTAYIPPRPYYELREITRSRARLVRRMTETKNELHTLLMSSNLHSPQKSVFCKSGVRWLKQVHLGEAGDIVRDEALDRLGHFEAQLRHWDDELAKLHQAFPQVDALTDIYGVGLYSALLIVGEIAEPWRFKNAKQVGTYAGLTARVSQSGEHCYHGSISRQGSAWFRWILVQIAMKVVRKDQRLNNFYTRVRKRSSAKKARVAVARKLAGICWVRLMRWHQAAAA
jgi:transposase